ncbi:hypothetical protein RDI58_027384 [Solanum bulbocastanum]|uniref:Uncharacterized protein n=1 Tax=Solanum bulbocastanum TaxID=147425 RepID=A0AAN8Y4A4_SOLBU
MVRGVETIFLVS